MQRVCDECGGQSTKRCEKCQNTMLCDTKECILAHGRIFCSVKQTYDCNESQCEMQHKKRFCVPVSKEIDKHLAKTLGLEDGKVIQYKGNPYIMFGGPIPGKVPHALRVLDLEPNCDDFFKAMNVTKDTKKWYYIIHWNDVARVLCFQLDREQKESLFLKSGGEKRT